MMMWKAIISDLVDAGMPEAKIARLVNYAQPTVHRLKTGAIKEPSYGHGKALIELHTRICISTSAA